MLKYAIFSIAIIANVATFAFAEERIATPNQKWRPKDGTYAGPRSDSTYDRCEDFGDIIVALSEKKISGIEWSCNIHKLIDTASDTITLNTACTEIEGKPSKSIFVIKKIDDSSFVYSALTNGKATADEKMSYCPEDMQRLYTDAKARDKAEAASKSAKKRTKK